MVNMINIFGKFMAYFYSQPSSAFLFSFAT